MSQSARNHTLDGCSPGDWAPGPSEAASAIEHRAALDATLFRREQRARELVLELDEGELRLRPRDD